MHRIEGANSVLNASGQPAFTDSPPGTCITARWLNAVQEELAGIIEAAGISLNGAYESLPNQLTQAVRDLSRSSITAYDSDGISFYNSNRTLIAKLYHDGRLAIFNLVAMDGSGFEFRDNTGTVVGAIAGRGFDSGFDSGFDMGALTAKVIRAYDINGLRIEDKSGHLAIFIENATGKIKVGGNGSPVYDFDVTGKGNFSLGLNAKGKLTGSVSNQQVFDYLAPFIPNVGETCEIQAYGTIGNHVEGVIATRTTPAVITVDMFDSVGGATTKTVTDNVVTNWATALIMTVL